VKLAGNLTIRKHVPENEHVRLPFPPPLDRRYIEAELACMQYHAKECAMARLRSRSFDGTTDD